MDNFIKNLEIKNFKSIKHLTLDCKRVNVFIGKPNVGKSNILEALGLFSSEFMIDNLNELIRMKKLDDLFFDFFLSDEVDIRLDNKFRLSLSFKSERNGVAVFFLNLYKNDDHIESIPLIRDGSIKWSDGFTSRVILAKYYKYTPFEPK